MKCLLACVNNTNGSIKIYVTFDNGFISKHTVFHHSCSAALCADPADIVNGMVTFTGNSVGDTATYTCNAGFELVGSVTTTCGQVDADSAVFSPEPPQCTRKYCIT